MSLLSYSFGLVIRPTKSCCKVSAVLVARDVAKTGSFFEFDRIMVEQVGVPHHQEPQGV